jgi:hypothetical protein
MPLWFEIAVLVFLACIAVALIDICFALESLTRNLANFGTRLESVVLPSIETIAKKSLERSKEQLF